VEERRDERIGRERSHWPAPKPIPTTRGPDGRPPPGTPAGPPLATGRSPFGPAATRRLLAAARSTAYSILQNDADADDTAQSVLVRCLDRIAALPDRSAVLRFVRVAARNAALDLRRANGRRPPAEPIRAVSDPRPSPHQLAEYRDFHATLTAALTRLSPRCRAVARLYLFEEYTRPEVAAELGMTLAAVEKQITRMYRLLRPQLGHFRP